MKETKEVLYIALDLLDSIHKSSKGSTFLKIDEKKMDQVKDEIFRLIVTAEEKDKNLDKKVELIGILPSALVDKIKFPNNESLNKFSEESLNVPIPFWDKRRRTEIIGRIIAEIDNKKEADFDTFFNAWKEFIKDDKNKEFKPGKKDYVNIWLEFFDHYGGDK